jgi:hypothetical protein
MWNYLLAPYILLGIIVTVHWIIAVRNRTSATTNIPPWSLFLPTTTREMENQSMPTNKRIARVSKIGQE